MLRPDTVPEPMFPAVMKTLLDNGFVGKSTIPLWTVPVAVIGMFVLRGLSTFLTTYMMTWVSTHLLNILRRQMFSRLLDVPAQFYERTSVGRVINSMMFEVQQIIEMVTKVFTSLLLAAAPSAPTPSRRRCRFLRAASTARERRARRSPRPRSRAGET